MSLPDDPITRPNRPGQGTMGHKVKPALNAFAIIPRPHPNKMITDQVRSTVILINRWRQIREGGT